MKTKLLIIIGMMVFSLSLLVIADAEARCSGPYPCGSPASPPISAEIAFRSDTIVSGEPTRVLLGSDALIGYDDKTDPENPCGLGLQYKEPNQGIVDFLNNSKHKAPFLYEFRVDKIHKNLDVRETIHILGIEKTLDRQYAQQFSHGYMFSPEIGEELLLYLRYFEEYEFGINCKIPDVFLVDKTQGSIWGWNKDDFVPDIYPGDVKIPPLKEQRAYKNFEEDKTISPAVTDLISCQLGMEPMYRLYLGSPFCVTEETADKIEKRGWAKRFSYFWTFDGLQYIHTGNYEKWRK